MLGIKSGLIRCSTIAQLMEPKIGVLLLRIHIKLEIICSHNQLLFTCVEPVAGARITSQAEYPERIESTQSSFVKAAVRDDSRAYGR